MTIIGYSKAALAMICDAIVSREMRQNICVLNNLNLPMDFHYKGFLINKVSEANDTVYFMGGVTPQTKKKLHELFRVPYDTLINAYATVSPNAKIGKGSIIDAQAFVSSGVVTGVFTTLYSNCTVSHDCMLGDFVTICPDACLCGNVNVGDGSFIGANSVVRQDITIGKNCVIGCGAVVVKDVADGETVYGNPAKPKPKPKVKKEKA